MYSNVDIKKYGDVESLNIAGHNLRQIPSANVNPKKSNQNRYFVGSPTMNFSQVLGEKLSKVEKIRKNAVKTVNLVFSASPELFKDRSKCQEWENSTWDFIKKEFGEENLIYAVVHKDEKTPHFHVCLIPVDPKGNLNASHFFDGRKKCNEFATRYNNAVKNLGLKRDKGKDKAKPEETTEFYRKIKKSEEFDQKVDQALNSIEKNLQSRAIFGMIKTSTAMNVFKPFAKLLKQLYAKSIQDSKEVKEAKKTAQKLADLELKVESLGLDPKMSFIRANEIKSIIELGTATAEARRNANSIPPQDVKNSVDYSTSHEVEFKKKFKPK